MKCVVDQELFRAKQHRVSTNSKARPSRVKVGSECLRTRRLVWRGEARPAAEMVEVVVVVVEAVVRDNVRLCRCQHWSIVVV